MEEECCFKVGDRTKYAMIKKDKIYWNLVNIKTLNEDGTISEFSNGMRVKFIEKTSCNWNTYEWKQANTKILIENKI